MDVRASSLQTSSLTAELYFRFTYLTPCSLSIFPAILSHCTLLPVYHICTFFKPIVRALGQPSVLIHTLPVSDWMSQFVPLLCTSTAFRLWSNLLYLLPLIIGGRETYTSIKVTVIATDRTDRRRMSEHWGLCGGVRRANFLDRDILGQHSLPAGCCCRIFRQTHFICMPRSASARVRAD